jgi:glycosyltransferase involved in cell wall biosynthesis
MRILHIYRTYFPDQPGGIQEVIRQISLATKKYNVESRVFCLSPYPDSSVVKFEEADVYPSKSWFAPASCDIGFNQAIQQFRNQTKWADIIHYHFPWPYADFLHFLFNHNKTSLMTYHSDIVDKGVLGVIYAPLMRKMISSMKMIIATSPSYIISSTTLSEFKNKSRLSVIPLGINEKYFTQPIYDSKNIDINKRFKLIKDNFFLFVGVLRPYKGLEYLCQAAEFTSLPIVIAGDGSMLNQLKIKHSSKQNIKFLGRVTDTEKYALISGCRSLVLPSHLRSEAFGVVLIEAAMCGKPMITCEIGTGTSYVNSDKETGFVVPPMDPDALANVMNKLAVDDSLCDNMGKQARVRYEKLFSGDALGKAYNKVYNELYSTHD